MGMTENTRICSLVMTIWYLRDLGPLLQGQTKVATLKSVYNSLMSYGNELASGENDLRGGYNLVSGGNDLVSSGNKLLSGEQFSKWWE